MPAAYYKFDLERKRKEIGVAYLQWERASGCVRDLIPCRWGRGSPILRPGGTCVSRGLRRWVRWPSLQRSLLDGRGHALLGERGVRGGGGRGRSQFASSVGRRMAGAPLTWIRYDGCSLSGKPQSSSVGRHRTRCAYKHKQRQVLMISLGSTMIPSL
jgi:hypothetical protein